MTVLPLPLLVVIAGVASPVNDVASFVDPFIGTQTTAQGDHGNTWPGATRPFGMLSWNPDPADGEYYRYESPTTRGFSLTHLSGTGCGVFGDVPIFPMLGRPEYSPAIHGSARSAPAAVLPYRATYDHANEVAEPGYYAVLLSSGIRVRLAAALRSGLAEVEFPKGHDAHDAHDAHTLLLDLGRNLTRVADAEVAMRGRLITGSVSSGGFCGLENRYRVYFALETQELPETVGTYDDRSVTAGSRAAHGARIGAYISFKADIRTVHFKVALSYVDEAHAQNNLKSEVPSWSIEVLRQQARAAWNDALGLIRVNGGTVAERKVLYTALYHALLHPSTFSDVNGDYRGFDDKVHKAKGRIQYANFSGWDIYRSQVHLIAMILPELASDLAQSLVADADQGGGLPLWPVANDESSAMVGDPSDAIIAGIYAFGGRSFETKAALAAMLRGASDPLTHIRWYPERPGLKDYLSQGYIGQTRDLWGAASVTLEWQNADFAIAAFAQALGEAKIAEAYRARAARWRVLFDSGTKYIRARKPDGTFVPKFRPDNPWGYVEGNAAQYTWMVPFDLAGLINAIGGDEAARTRLDNYFSHYGSYDGGPYFYIANEPSFAHPWIYNWTGHPWRAQEVVRKTLSDLFQDRPDGLPGNDDLGATSSWAVFAHLGLYPAIPGIGGLALSTPIFPDVTLTIRRPHGKDGTIRIVAPEPHDHPYIAKAAVGARAVTNWWIDWDDLVRAGQLQLDLTAHPNHDASERPPSFAPDPRRASPPALRSAPPTGG